MKALWLLCACDIAEPVAPRVDVSALRPLTAADGHTYAVVELRRTISECSNLGGTHYTFTVDEPGNPRRLIHAGGHGASDLHLPSATYYVADVTLKQWPDPAVSNAGWCLDDMPAYSGEAMRFVPARDLSDARMRLVEIVRWGWPAVSYAPTR